jgi:hypothetical protein
VDKYSKLDFSHQRFINNPNKSSLLLTGAILKKCFLSLAPVVALTPNVVLP